MLFSAFAFSGSPFGEEFVSGVQNASASAQPSANVLASCVRKVIRDVNLSSATSITADAVRVRFFLANLDSSLSISASAFLTASRSVLLTLASTTSASGGYVKRSGANVGAISTVVASAREKWEPIADSPETWGTIPVSSEAWSTLSEQPKT